MHWRTRFSKVKHSLGDAWNTSMKVLSVADRAHALASKGLDVIRDRLDEDVQDKFDGALQTHALRSRQVKNVDRNLREVGGM